MASGLPIHALRFAATALLAFAGVPAAALAADGNAEFSLPSIADALDRPNATSVGYSRPKCCNPGCPNAACPGSSQPSAETPPSATDQTPQSAELEPQAFGGLGSSTWAINDAPGGYIDNPIVGTWFRLRYDDASNNTAPDRAEYFYAKCACAGGPGPAGPGGTTGVAASHVDYRKISPYLEVLLYPRLSVFAELPVQFVDLNFPALSASSGGSPSSFNSNGGLADMNAGFKYALFTDPCRYLTFQFRTYIPTGNPAQGLGTNHVSLEPALLYLRRLSTRSYFQGEFRDWIPVGGTDFAGNVLQYGAGVGYDVYRTYDAPLNPYTSNGGLRITAVTEFVGWSVLGGKELVSTQNIAGGVDQTIQSAKGDTIVNLKLGVRASVGKSSFYAGWGHALTTDTWYSDLLRLEFRRMF